MVRLLLKLTNYVLLIKRIPVAGGLNSFDLIDLILDLPEPIWYLAHLFGWICKERRKNQWRKGLNCQ